MMRVLANIARTGWRPALGWVSVAGAWQAFVVGREIDTVQLVAFLTLVVTHIGVRAWEKTKGQS